ncbi:MAG: hypothetical protein QOD85_2253 [Gaiellaceae bacterium]|jgi:enamine deaminase RidA (YjgF/YER057c/UK114 family)|nr:hypothetical protein [Gaiellaceae bacterium]
MIRVRASVLCLVALVAFAGCGSSPKQVTKAQYQAKLDTVGADLGRAGSQVGKAIDIATFNRDVENFQTHLRDAVKELKGVKPPPNAQAVNTMLANAFHDLADELEPVKDARRVSIVKARAALLKVSKSQAIKDGREAVKKLNRLGYDTTEIAAL